MHDNDIKALTALEEMQREIAAELNKYNGTNKASDMRSWLATNCPQFRHGALHVRKLRIGDRREDKRAVQQPEDILRAYVVREAAQMQLGRRATPNLVPMGNKVSTRGEWWGPSGLTGQRLVFSDAKGGPLKLDREVALSAVLELKPTVHGVLQATIHLPGVCVCVCVCVCVVSERSV